MSIFSRAGIRDSSFACLLWCLTLSILPSFEVPDMASLSKEGTTHTNRRQSRFTTDIDGIETLMISERLLEERRPSKNDHIAWKLEFRGSLIDNVAGGKGVSWLEQVYS